MEKECVTALNSLVKVLYLSTKTFEPFAYGQLTSKNAATRLAVECVTALIVRLPSCEYLLGVLGSIDVRRKLGGIPGAYHAFSVHDHLGHVAHVNHADHGESR